MATTTTNYNLTKPTMAEIADIRTLNNNMDKVDEVMHSTQVSLAPAYDLLETYNTGDKVMYELLMYKCKEDNVTGAWNPAKWERTTAGENGSGGGGSSVVPNPSGTPTDTLNTIGIDGTIFDISGSGGGGTGEGSFYKETTLWSGSDSASMTLSESFENYDAIMVIARTTYNNTEYSMSAVWLTSYLSDHINDGMRFGLTGDSWYIYFSITDDTTFARQDQYYFYISEIKGLKFGGGSGSAYAETLLYDSGSPTSGAPFNQDVALFDNLSNYDAIVVEWNTYEDRIRESPLETSDTVFCTVQDLLSNNFCLHFSGYDTRWGEIIFTDTTFKLFARGGDLTPQIYKIKGLKFGGGANTRIDLLWDYVNDNSGNIYWSGNALTLNGDIRNYDEVVVEIVSAQGDVSDQWKSSYQWRLLVDPLINSFEPGTFTMCSYDQRSAKFQFTNTTLQKLLGNGSENGVIRVYGVTYGGGGSDSGNGYSETSLYTYTGSTRQTTLSLSDDYTNYDAIEFTFGWNLGGDVFETVNVIASSKIVSNVFVNVGGEGRYNYISRGGADDEIILATATGSWDGSSIIREVRGINY